MGPSGMDDANSEVYFRHQNERFSRDHINSLETTAKALVKTIADLEAAAKEAQATISIQSSRIAALEADAARLREAMLDAVEKLNASEPALNGKGWTLAPIRNEMLSALGETK